MPEIVCTGSCEQVSRRAFPTTRRDFGSITRSSDHRAPPYQGDIMKMVKKILLFTLVAFLIYAVVKYPTLAADFVQNVWNFIVQIFKSLFSFFNSILTR
jgi:nitrate reductase NapE component